MTDLDQDKTFSILFAGVGGQGVLLGAEITALAATDVGYDVKQTEVHGISQRGGSVETHVRFGKKVWSPIVTPGRAHIVMGLEKLEALRFAHYADPLEGIIFVNEHQIIPGSVTNAEELYPSDIIGPIEDRGYRIHVLEASRIAHELGDGRMANIVMVGAMCKHLPIPEEVWLDTIRTRIPARFRESNLQAFASGKAAAAEIDP
jgi:indolepyruvate ferredoxin oxidoreductase beta subunit